MPCNGQVESSSAAAAADVMVLKPERVGCQCEEKKDGPNAFARLAVGSVRDPERNRCDADCEARVGSKGDVSFEVGTCEAETILVRSDSARSEAGRGA